RLQGNRRVQSAYDTTTPSNARIAWIADRPAAYGARMDTGAVGGAIGGLARGGIALRDGPGAAERALGGAAGRAVQARAARVGGRHDLSARKGGAPAGSGLPLHRGRAAVGAAAARS